MAEHEEAYPVDAYEAKEEEEDIPEKEEEEEEEDRFGTYDAYQRDIERKKKEKQKLKKDRKKRKKIMNFFRNIMVNVQQAKKEHEAFKSNEQHQAGQEEEELQLALALSQSAEGNRNENWYNHNENRPPRNEDEDFQVIYRNQAEAEEEARRKREEEDLQLALKLYQEQSPAPSPALPSVPMEVDEEELMAKALAESLKEEEERKRNASMLRRRDSEIAREMQEEEIKSARDAASAILGTSSTTGEQIVEDDPFDPSIQPKPLRDSGFAQQIADEEYALQLQREESATTGVSPTTSIPPELEHMSEAELSERMREELLNNQKEAFLRRLEEDHEAKRMADEQREMARLESAERERIIQEQNEAYQESLRQDMLKEQQRLEEERKEQEEKARQEAEKELESAKELSIQLSRETELQHKKEKWANTPQPDQNATTGICALVIRLPTGERLQNKFFATDTLETVRNFVDIKLLEDAVAASTTPTTTEGSTAPSDVIVNPLRYTIVASYPYKKFTDTQQTLTDAGLCPRALVNIEQEAVDAVEAS